MSSRRASLIRQGEGRSRFLCGISGLAGRRDEPETHLERSREARSLFVGSHLSLHLDLLRLVESACGSLNCPGRNHLGSLPVRLGHLPLAKILCSSVDIPDVGWMACSTTRIANVRVYELVAIQVVLVAKMLKPVSSGRGIKFSAAPERGTSLRRRQAQLALMSTNRMGIHIYASHSDMTPSIAR